MFKTRVDLAIDHHPSYEHYAAESCVHPECAACGEILCALAQELGQLTKAVALPLYVAVSTDTGCFVYSNVTANTHRAAAALMETGIDYRAVNKLHFRTKSKKRLALEGELLRTMEFYDEDRVVIVAVPQSLQKRMALTEADMEDLAALGGVVEGTDCAVTMKETKDGAWKVSMRTGARVNATLACSKLGGGGHRAASGCLIEHADYETARVNDPERHRRSGARGAGTGIRITQRRKGDHMPNGIIIIDKPAGWTSMDVCAKLRGILHEKRVGHAGTLDPMATGVLPVFVGQATKAVSFAEGGKKVYEAVLQLGRVTDTQDTTGETLEERAVTVTADDVRAALPRFLGEIEQIPPMYSAIKVNGQKLYDLARQGKEVARKPRRITIYDLALTEELGNGQYALRVECSKGTYIRTLCHDLGQALGCGGCMAALRRTEASGLSYRRGRDARGRSARR